MNRRHTTGAGTRSAAVGMIAALLAVTGCTSATPTPSPTATSARPEPTPSASGRTAGVKGITPDFDGDGDADLVAGTNGMVSVRYANGGSVDITSKDVSSPIADSYQFGRALLARDLNGDGYTDLVVSDTEVDQAMALYFLSGSAKGLDVAGVVAVRSESYPGAGGALALVTDPTPVLVVGPSVTSHLGLVLAYPLGADGHPSGEPRALKPQDLGLPDIGGDSDFGTALAASGSRLVIGAPRAGVGTTKEAGAVYSVDLSSDPLRAVRTTQDTPGVPDNAQTGDRFGAALAMNAAYLMVGVPGEDRQDENGHNQRGTGMVQPFQIMAGTLQPMVALDQLDLPGNVEAGDGFGSALSMARPCRGADGVLVGAWAEAIGKTEWAGSVWLVPLSPDAECAPLQLYGGAGLGKAEYHALVGSAVSVLPTRAGGDTLVIGAQGDTEQSVQGRVLTLDYPYRDEPSVVLKDFRVMFGESFLSFSPPQG